VCTRLLPALLALIAAPPSSAGANSCARPLCCGQITSTALCVPGHFAAARPQALHSAYQAALLRQTTSTALNVPTDEFGPPPTPGPAQSANQIVVMAGGKVVEVGTHEELSATSQHYAELMKAGELMLAST